MKGDKGSSAGARHGSNATDTADRDPKSASGLNERTGEFNVGEKIIFGMRNGNVLIRHSPQGDEIEVAEATLAGLMIDAFFTDKFGNEYPTVTGQRK
jgi:outer membrane protein W